MARLPHFEELATITKSTMMNDQVLMLMKRKVDKDLKFEDKFKELCLEVADIVKDKQRCVQHGDMEKVTCLQVMVNEAHLGVCEKLLFVVKMKEGLLG
ncbi:hypothetical protein Tco_0887809 [Tanacetum coccineum]